jgi:putative oxidoreductase
MLMNVDVGILLLRIVLGIVFMGHGAQKTFGWFGGKGLRGHIALMEKMNAHPAPFWALVNALGELLGGLGILFGLLTPFAAAAIIGSMLVAIIRVHWAKGFWNANGGIEFPLTLGTAGFIIGLMGPGIYSLDNMIGLAFAEPVTYLVALVAMLIAVLFAVMPAASAAGQEHRTA